MPDSQRADLGLFLIRFACAIVFLYHGSAILFGAFGGPGPVNFAAHMRAPVVVGYLVGLAQVVGGLAILTGILFRIGAVCLMIVMLGAIFMVHLPHGFNIANNGAEFALTEFLLALGLLLTGPGHFALQSALPGSLRKL
jgi:putative oxidoreductase